jgi:hypothetical protein
MKCTILAVALTAGMLCAGAGVALAQTTGPDTVACTNAKTDDASADAALKADAELEKANTAFVKARAVAAATIGIDGNFINDSEISLGDIDAQIAKTTGVLQDNLKSLKLALQAMISAKTEADKTNAGILVQIAARTDAVALCKAPVVTTTTPPPPTTTTPPPTTTPAPRPVDLNCDDFPLSDGRTAQQILDADLTDPNVLDANNNKIACEVADGNGGDEYEDSTSDNVVPDVSEGIETGVA